MSAPTEIEPTNQSPERWLRWLIRSAYETGLPRGRRDVAEAGIMLVLALTVRALAPMHDWLVRAVAAYLIAGGATLLLGYGAHYAGRRLRKVTA